MSSNCWLGFVSVEIYPHSLNLFLGGRYYVQGGTAV